ncbi:hypothetical protein FMM74_020725 [Lachnospiraceae bacterium MD308]|nr:hypothetical protein [Lachnospiraceae bacterium MD308]
MKPGCERHKIFIDEMRSAMKKTEMEKSQYNMASSASSTDSDEYASLQEELERRFDELFGIFDDE